MKFNSRGMIKIKMPATRATSGDSSVAVRIIGFSFGFDEIAEKGGNGRGCTTYAERTDRRQVLCDKGRGFQPAPNITPKERKLGFPETRSMASSPPPRCATQWGG